ncbi:ABC transporter substrate-binding protein [Thermodesulfobacteriota bacterium]
MRTTRCILIIALVAWVFVFSAAVGSAAGKPTTVAELAMYKGTDRQQILEAGAKKEGKLIFYTTGILKQSVRPIVNAFQKKYPYIKVQIWRAGTRRLVPKVIEEYKAGRHVVDVIEPTQSAKIVLAENQILRAFYSPNAAYIEEGAYEEVPGGGYLWVGHYQSGIGLGYNTKLISKEKLPKTYQELLDPKWRGKIPITSSNTSVNWMGTMLVTHGEEFVKQMAKQDFIVHSISGRALLDLIIAGEYEFSPTCFNSHVSKSKGKEAAIDWMPLEPVHTLIGMITLPKNPPHPHASLLFIDFDLTKQAGEIYKANGYLSPRKDVPGESEYKKHYGARSSEEVRKWQKLFSILFTKK